MPQTRYIETYDRQGNLLERTAYSISQEETDKELAEKIITEISTLKDEELTMPKIARFLRALAETRR